MRRGWGVVSAVVLGVILAMLPAPLKWMFVESSILGYVALDYWRLGLSWEQARRDYIYTLWEAQTPSLLFWTPMLHAKEMLTNESLSQPVLPSDDHITAVCKASMYVQMTSEDSVLPLRYFDAPTADAVDPEERLRAYLESCRAVYGSLDVGGRHRHILDELEPRIVANVTTPILLDATASKAEAEGAKLQRESLAAGLALGGRRSVETTGSGDIADKAYARYGLKPAPLEVIRVSEIPDAVRQGRMARFDATEFLPRSLFNISIMDVARWHGEEAEGIPMYRQQSVIAPTATGWEPLSRYAARVERLIADGRAQVPACRPWRPSEYSEAEKLQMSHIAEGATWWLRKLDGIIQTFSGFPPSSVVNQAHLKATQCAVNVRRLTRLPVNLSMEAALGSPPWLERAQSLFWLGAVTDCWHFDDPDNLVIAVSGEIHITVYEPQYTELLRAHGGRGCWSRIDNVPKKFTDPSVIQANPWLTKVPFYTLRLEPGQGVVIPSRAYHSLAVPDVNRIMLNAFLHPRFGELWDAPAAKHSFYRPEFQTEQYAALRHLKASSLFHLWDTKRIGGWFELSKLEIL